MVKDVCDFGTSSSEDKLSFKAVLDYKILGSVED